MADVNVRDRVRDRVRVRVRVRDTVRTLATFGTRTPGDREHRSFLTKLEKCYDATDVGDGNDLDCHQHQLFQFSLSYFRVYGTVNYAFPK